ncbi:MAG TPA: DUF3302 domain-containing protein [Verrucomicrobiae bacterium]|nr:DUF3302 domain-containing protein [Verrucomicrobiae bacterium]
MNFLDLFSVFILVVISGVFIAILLVIAWFPGNVARKRHSPWAESISVAGCIGILLPPIWILALIVAFYRARTGPGASITINEAESADLAASLAVLSQRITNLENTVR